MLYFPLINEETVHLNLPCCASSHVVQMLPALLIEFPYYCIISLKPGLGCAMCCLNIHFIIESNPFYLHLISTAPPLTNLSQQFRHNKLNKIVVADKCWHSSRCLKCVFCRITIISKGNKQNHISPGSSHWSTSNGVLIWNGQLWINLSSLHHISF